MGDAASKIGAGGNGVSAAVSLTKKDFESEQEVRWCPGCGDYAILAQVQKVLPTLGIPREKFVFVSGIGCSSRFPYYMNTYGLHSIHGRAPTFASGLKVARPDLQVWVITGDGDALSIGGNHFIHALRRNIGIKILLFNNRIYGLTKGQYSPTSEMGKVTKSTPLGSIDFPFNPISLALGAEASFVARSVDSDPMHLQSILKRAAEHQGSALVEIFQNCVVFNDGAFDEVTAKAVRAEQQIVLENGKPLIFGKNKDKGIRVVNGKPEVVALGNGVSEKDLLRHDEATEDGSLAFLLSRLTSPRFPTPVGVFRQVKRPAYEELAVEQEKKAIEKSGVGDLNKLLRSGETWTVN